MEEKKCLIIYFGNGYSENVLSHNLEYYYSVDMRENKENHYEMIYQPLYDLGYKIDNVLVTNKHEHYDEFVKEYSAIPVFYDEITKEDEHNADLALHSCPQTSGMFATTTRRNLT